MLGLLATGYAGSKQLGYSYITFAFPYAYTYLPTGMVQSSIPFTDIPDVTAALRWMNENAPRNAIVLVQEKIQGFAYIELRSDFLIRDSPSLITLNEAIKLVSENLNTSYAVWYTENVDYRAFSGSIIVEFGRIGIFEIQENQ
jgi:hypothetical protein